MTEAEWLACPDPIRLLNSLCRTWGRSLFEIGRWIGVVRQNGTERRLRLYACACMRRVWSQLKGEGDRRAIELAEAYVEGAVPLRDLIAAREQLDSFTPIGVTETSASAAAISSAHEAADLVASKHLDDPRRPAVLRELANTLRDIFGNPFRPVTTDRVWLTSTVVALATGIYEDHAFDRMPILADALQDAGCDNEDVLNHCRSEGPHYRGCWVVDLLLGKS